MIKTLMLSGIGGRYTTIFLNHSKGAIVTIDCKPESMLPHFSFHSSVMGV